MEKIKSLVLSIPLKTKLVLLLILSLASLLYSVEFQISTQKNIYFNINEVNILPLKIKNLSDTQVTVLPDFIPNESFSVISPLESLIFSPGEEKYLYYSFLVENTQNSQSFSLPFILREITGKEIHREFIRIIINPYSCFKARLIKPANPIIDNKENYLELEIQNESNIPCLGDIKTNGNSTIKDTNHNDYSQSIHFYLQAGQTDTLAVSSAFFSHTDSSINFNLSISYKLIYPDSVVNATHYLNEIIPYYPIYQPDLKRFVNIPAYLSNKIQESDYTDHTEWKHWISFWGHGNFLNTDSVNKDQTNYVSWYLKKQNGRFINQWTDYDEYQMSFVNNKTALLFGKTNFEHSKLLGNHYGDGFETRYFFDNKAITYNFVKDFYKGQNSYSTLSFELMKNHTLNDEGNKKLFSIILQTKRSEFSWSGLAGKNTVTSSDNDKLVTQFSFFIVPGLQFNNELLWFRNNDTNNSSNPLFYNELSYTRPNTHIDLKNRYQNVKIDGEYDYHKSYEANIYHRYQDLLSVFTGLRYSDEKSNYSWSFPFRQIYQSHYLKPKVKIWKPLFAVGDINYYRFESSNHQYNSEDVTYLGGLALDFNHFYIESQIGKREYDYSSVLKRENIIRVNFRYFFSDKLMILFDSKSTQYQNNIDFNQFLVLEFKPLKTIKTSLSYQNYQYENKPWQDLMIGEGNLSYTLNNQHQLLFSGKYFDFINNRNQNRFSLSLEYIIPFKMPVYPKKRLSDLTIEICDPYQNAPAKNLLLKANNMFMMTDDSGKAEFLNIPHGDYHLSIVNPDKEYMISPALPDKVTLGKKELLNKKYQLKKPAEIYIQVIEKENIPLHLNSEQGKQSIRFINNELIYQQVNMAKKTSKGILFVLQNGDIKIVKETDINGKLFFDHIPEGNWILYPLKQSIPQDYQFTNEEMSIDIEANKKYYYDFELVPSSIPFESFSNGGKVKIKD